MSNWKHYADQEKPCENCSEPMSIANKGIYANYCSDRCIDEARNQIIKEESSDKAKYTFEEVIRGKDTGKTDQQYFNKLKINKAIGQLEMLGFTGEADRLREANKSLLNK